MLLNMNFGVSSQTLLLNIRPEAHSYTTGNTLRSVFVNSILFWQKWTPTRSGFSQNFKKWTFFEENFGKIIVLYYVFCMPLDNDTVIFQKYRKNDRSISKECHQIMFCTYFSLKLCIFIINTHYLEYNWVHQRGVHVSST